nr:NADH dehydrogenase subunit 4 [Hypoponera sauteri]
MMKIFFFLFSMLMILLKNSMVMFYYNMMFLMSMIFLFNYYNNNLSMMESNIFSVDYYSFMLVMLSLWIMGLMFMHLKSKEGLIKKMVFILMLLILFVFFSVKNLMLFYLFFELSLIPTFMLIIYWGYNPERLSAAYYMLMYTLLISLPLMVYFMYMYMIFGSFDMNLLLLLDKMKLSLWMFLILVGAFFVKMPIYMFHIWLPKAHVEAPVYGSMILAAILLKLGSYGLLRILMIFMSSVIMYKNLIISISIWGSFVISLVCLVQVDMKSLVAYSSVVHMNLMLCGLMSFFSLGFISSYMIMVAHGLCSSGLFYMVNSYYYRSFSRLMVMNKGMINIMPSLSMWWFFLCSSNFSFPLSIGFIGEIYFLGVLINLDMLLLIYLIMISFFSSAYSLYLFAYVQQGESYLMKTFDSGELKEILVMMLHFMPLMLMLLNLMF